MKADIDLLIEELNEEMEKRGMSPVLHGIDDAEDLLVFCVRHVISNIGEIHEAWLELEGDGEQLELDRGILAADATYVDDDGYVCFDDGEISWTLHRYGWTACSNDQEMWSTGEMTLPTSEDMEHARGLVKYYQPTPDGYDIQKMMQHGEAGPDDDFSGIYFDDWFFTMDGLDVEEFGPYDTCEEANEALERVRLKGIELNDGIERNFEGPYMGSKTGKE